MAGRPRSALIDGALREAALALFVEKGWPGFTLDEVARRAGVSRTALYRRWSSRENLLGDALQTWRGAYNDRPDGECSSLSNMIDDLTRKATAAFGDPFVRALLTRVLTLDPENHGILKPYWTQAVAAQRAHLTCAIEAAQKEGYVAATVDPSIVLDAVAGALACALLSGTAARPGFDAAVYIRSLFLAVGLK